MGKTEPTLPRGYQGSRSMDATSRWMVFYKGDPEFFLEKTNAIGGERIKTFATKKAATQAVFEHEAMVAKLKVQPQL